MTIVKHAWIGEPPKDPHLGILTDESGEATAIPPGALMYIIENPAKPDGVIPLILMKVSRKRLTFKCGCNKPDCTRMVKFEGKWTGFHPSSEDQHVTGYGR